MKRTHAPIRFLVGVFIMTAILERGGWSESRSAEATESAPDQTGVTQEMLQHVEELKKKVPEGFTVLPQPPFAVIGDSEPARVKHCSDKYVKWAYDGLKQDYFAHDPVEIIDIWLFRDKASYEKNTEELFGDKPDTPFGYFSEPDHALIVNVSRGFGTIVHEIVHALMWANFPKCPPWFNEGLASLFEHPQEKDGHLRGQINWRLKQLESAIKSGKLISFKKLLGLSESEFYGSPDGYSSHYPQARYLCYYLQEKGLLVKFYHEFVEHAEDDPTGYNTIKRVLGEEDMTAFEKRWRLWALQLRLTTASLANISATGESSAPLSPEEFRDQFVAYSPLVMIAMTLLALVCWLGIRARRSHRHQRANLAFSRRA